MYSLALFILMAAAVAAVVTFIVTSRVYTSRLNSVKEELNLKDAQLKAQERILEERKAVYEKSLQDMKESSEASLRNQIAALRSEVTATTEKVLKSRQDELSQQNKSGLGEILNPLKDSIESMKKALAENEKENVRTTTELKDSLAQAVKAMGERTAEVGAKADSLSEALTGKPKVQGCWGENFLDDILSKEGLEPGLHYDREVSGADLSRPDFVFHFMDGMECKDLVVDSKVSLTAYVEYMNSSDEQLRREALSRHVRSVRKHIDELASKNYASKIETRRRFADYVLMFMPIDMAYRVAMDADYTIWQYAYSKGVIITTEQTIMPFLKVIRLTWNKYTQEAGIMEMMTAAQNVIERVGLFYESYKELGGRLKGAVKEYNNGVVKLEDNGKSITTSARQLLRLGAKRKKGKPLMIPDEQILLEDDYFEGE